LSVKNDNGGAFANISHVQRVSTWAGQPPAAAPKKAGEVKEVRYQATYVFLGSR
jgi:hypothetical protein